jgi:hypothetical protein
MSLRPENSAIETPGSNADVGGAAMLEDALASDGGALAEGNNFSTVGPNNPLKRSIVVSISATLAELCNQQKKAVWQPSRENIRSIMQQRKFTSLSGSGEAQGDLKSIVLHDMSVSQVASTFPIALGAKVTGVDNMTYASTGEPYSLVVLPKTTSVQSRLLQKDDVSVAYNFANKFPGYTAQNIATKGIHEVSQRRFVLVAADRECHPSSTQQPSPLLTRASPWQTRSSRPSRCAASAPTPWTPSTPDSRWLRVETLTSSRARALTSALPCVWQENADKCAVTQTLSTQTLLTLPH